jgi:hypothetical protein
MPYDYAYGKHEHHKGIFFLTVLVVTGLCSVFPFMCFKHYSGEEKKRQRDKAREDEREAKRQTRRADKAEKAARHAIAHAHSPRTAHTPHHRRPRRHSTVKLRHTHDFPGQRFRDEDEEELGEMLSYRNHPSTTRHTNDRQLDRER